MLFLVTVSTLAFSQEKLPKVRVSTGFLSTRYELGEKFVPEKDVLNHFETHNSKAYYYMKEGRGYKALATGLTIAGAACLLAGVITENTAVTVISVPISLGAFVFSMMGGSKKDKAVDVYNTAAGY